MEKILENTVSSKNSITFIDLQYLTNIHFNEVNPVKRVKEFMMHDLFLLYLCHEWYCPNGGDIGQYFGHITLWVHHILVRLINALVRLMFWRAYLQTSLHTVFWRFICHTLCVNLILGQLIKVLLKLLLWQAFKYFFGG